MRFGLDGRHSEGGGGVGGVGSWFYSAALLALVMLMPTAAHALAFTSLPTH